MKTFIPKTSTREQAKDTGMAIVLMCLLVAFFTDKKFFYGLAILILVVNMVWPTAFKPVAKVWLGFSHLLGAVMSKIVLTVIFVVLVVPMGLARKILGKDSLQLRKWKKDRTSVFKIREHEFTADDIKHPY